MGEAKRRGTYEQRREAAIARNDTEIECRKLERVTIEASKTLEEKREEYFAKTGLFQLLWPLGMCFLYKFPKR